MAANVRKSSWRESWRGMVDIAQSVTDWLKDILTGIPVEYGQFPNGTGAAQAMLKAAPGEPWVLHYCSGGGIKQFPYEVYLQTRPLDEQERIDGLAMLRKVQAAIEAGGAPAGVVVYAHDVTTLPSPFSVGEDGVATYQLIAQIKYRV